LKRQKAIKRSEQAIEKAWPEMQRKIAERQLKQAQYKAKYGEVKQQITADFKEHKIVAVGNRVYYSKAQSCKTFHDFLGTYVRVKLTPEWGNAEIAKPEEEKHQIIKLYQQLCKWQAKQVKDADGIYRTHNSGVSAAYFQLAYDLYVLDHHMKLQEEIIRRLKIKEGYQGARFELTIAATFIRAGFDIEYEDETDKLKKHPEFVAIHRETGEKIAVEAKSRHREGVLGQPGDPKGREEIKAGINRILNNALAKFTNHPYIVCIDLNMPPINGNVVDSPVFQEIARTVENKETNYTEIDGFPITMYVFTNYPHHYVTEDELDPTATLMTTLAKRPKYQFQHGEIVHHINRGFAQYGNIPNEFEDNT